MRRSRLLLAALLSLALHLALGLLVWRVVPEPPLRAAEPLSIEFLEHAPPRQAPAVTTKPPVTPPVPPRPARPTPHVKPPQTVASALPPAPEPPAAPPPSPPRPEDDMPRAVRLLPGPGGLPVAGLGGPAADASSGHTSRPDQAPSPEQSREEEEKQVKERVQGFVAEDFGELRVKNGLVNPYFYEMGHAMEQKLTGAPLFNYQGTLRSFFPPVNARGALARAGRYGATGTPDEVLGGPSGTDRLEDLARGGTAGARARASPQNTLGTLEDQAAEANTLSVELELVQSPTGGLLSVKLVRGSGNSLFDAYVLERVPPSLAALAPASEAFATMARGATVRSLWRVRGRVSFTRTLKVSKDKLDAGDVAYLAGLLPLGLLAGRFDEMRGEVLIPDLRRPHFDIHTQLLRVY